MCRNTVLGLLMQFSSCFIFTIRVGSILSISTKYNTIQRYVVYNIQYAFKTHKYAHILYDTVKLMLGLWTVNIEYL